MKKFVLVFVICILLASSALFALACGNADKGGEGITITDCEGREVVVPQNPQRVVSLQGSFAETWLTAGGKLVGATTDAFEDLNLDMPKAVAVGTVKNPNAEVVISLCPDFVIMSDDIAGHKEIAKTLDSAGIKYAYFRQETFEDYLSMLETFCKLTGNQENYRTYGVQLKERIEKVVAQAKGQSEKPRVLFVRARSQGVSAKASDHMVCTMLDDFGCENIAAMKPSLLENLSLEQIIKEDPDVILVTSMGDEEAAKAYLKKEWESNPAWSGLTAVKNGRYVFLQKNLFHFKPNARWADAYETLFDILF